MTRNTMTMEEARATHDQQVDDNRQLGVHKYKNDEIQSTEVYEVIEGYKTLPGGVRIGPGHRFHPTVSQVESNSLRGKARPLTATEMRGLERATAGKDTAPNRNKLFAGADFGLNDVRMSQATRDVARELGLKEEDFENVDPIQGGGYYSVEQVRGMAAAKAQGLQPEYWEEAAKVDGGAETEETTEG